MSKVRKDTSILEKYREEYEAGKITQLEIQQNTDIKKDMFRTYIYKNNWNMDLAKKNREKLYREAIFLKIKDYQSEYESGNKTIATIAKELKTKSEFVSIFAKENNWNGEVHKQTKINNGKHNLIPITGKNHIWEKAMQATKKRWEKLHQFSNLEKGSTIYVSGVAYIWNGFKHNKARLKTLLYSKHTYTEAQIKKYETQKK
jgi:hypothetical protein